MASSIRIEITPHSQGSRVFIDGQEIGGIMSVEVRAAVDESSLVTLHLRAAQVTIEGAAGSVVRRAPAGNMWNRWWAWVWRGQRIVATRMRSTVREFRAT